MTYHGPPPPYGGRGGLGIGIGILTFHPSPMCSVLFVTGYTYATAHNDVGTPNTKSVRDTDTSLRPVLNTTYPYP